jgi:hypothetical protein
MEVKDFDEFVQRQLVGLSEWDQIDWDRARNEWLRYLDLLYKKVEGFLSRYTSTGKIRIRYAPVDLNDERLGAYTADRMILQIGRQEILLAPSGSLFMDFKGLVKVIGSAAEAVLVLAEKDRHSTLPRFAGSRTGQRTDLLQNEPVVASEKIEWIWKIMPRPPERRLIELTEESFFQLILEVSNG